MSEIAENTAMDMANGQGMITRFARGIVRASLLCVVTLFGLAFSQEESKDMRMLKLKLQEAQLQLEQATAALTKAEDEAREAQDLFGKGLYNKAELSQAERELRSAKLRKESASIDLEKTRLAFLNNALYVTLERAALYLDKDGRKHVSITVKNNSNLSRIIDTDGRYTTEQKMALLGIENMNVRLLLDNKIIGRPFEQKIPLLRYNQSRDVDFTLQRDTDMVTIELSYADTLLRLPVFLEKEAKDDRLRMVANLYSQEGVLGTRVDYIIKLERFVDDDRSFLLQVRNLPTSYSYSFFDTEQNSQVSSISFNKGVTTKTLKLTLNMPKEARKEELNRKLGFVFLVLDNFAQQRLEDMGTQRKGLALRREDFDSARVSYVPLEVVPRGRAEMEVICSNLFIKDKLGHPIKLSFDLHNSGTVPLDQVRLTYPTTPLNWTINSVPEKDITLDVDGKKRVELEIIPASDAVAGDYEIKVVAKTMHEGREIQSTDKVLRIQLEGRSNILIGALLLIVLIGMIGGVAVMTIKVSRR